VASIVGITVVGALVASTVNVTFAPVFTIGEVTQNLNDLLNSIVPHFGNIVAVALIYWGLGRKKMTSSKMIVLIIIAGIILGGIGFLS
jgi:PTS system mannose-specific IID component